MPMLQTIQGLRLATSLVPIVVEYRPKGFIIDEVAPTVPVNLEQGIYYKFDSGNFAVPETLRAPRSVYKEIDWSMSEDTYKANEHGLEGRIDDRERKNVPGALDLDVGLTRRLTNGVLLGRERRGASLLMSTANITQNTTLVGAAQWSDPTSNPGTQASAARTAIRAKTGFLPNQLTMGYAVFESLRIHPLIIDFVEGARPTLQDIAEYFEVERVVVAQTIYNAAKEGQTDSLSDVWGKDALFSFTTENVAIDEPSFAYQFVVQELQPFRYRDTTVNCDVLRVTEIRAIKIVAPELAYLVKAAVA
jgi:hypothetical protein